MLRFDDLSLKLKMFLAPLFLLAALVGLAAYTLVQSLLCQYAAYSRKVWHLPFAPLRRRMQMQTAEFAYACVNLTPLAASRSMFGVV